MIQSGIGSLSEEHWRGQPCFPAVTTVGGRAGVTGDGAGRERAGEQHDQVAARGKDGVDGHEDEHDQLRQVTGHRVLRFASRA
jgi:hypothetical protein